MLVVVALQAATDASSRSGKSRRIPSLENRTPRRLQGKRPRPQPPVHRGTTPISAIHTGKVSAEAACSVVVSAAINGASPPIARAIT